MNIIHLSFAFVDEAAVGAGAARSSRAAGQLSFGGIVILTGSMQGEEDGCCLWVMTGVSSIMTSSCRMRPVGGWVWPGWPRGSPGSLRLHELIAEQLEQDAGSEHVVVGIETDRTRGW